MFKQKTNKYLIYLIIFGLIIIIFFHKKESFKKYNHEYFQNKNYNKINTELIINYIENCKNNNKKCISLPHQSFRTDLLRIRSIQNAGQTNFDKYNSNLYEDLKNITNLNPYREYPYIFTQYLLPVQKHGFKNNSGTQDEIAQKSRNQAVEIGEKGIKYLCNQSGCTNYEIPKTLAFSYFYYLNELEKAKKYYEIASNSPNSPDFLKQMPSIIEGRIGNHQKSAIMRYEKHINNKEENKLINEDTFLKKAIFEYSLNIIEESYKNQDICKKNIGCLKKNGLIKKEITNQIEECKKNNLESEKKIICDILQKAIKKNFIKKDGILIYPLDDNLTYGYRPDINDRRVIEKTSN